MIKRNVPYKVFQIVMIVSAVLAAINVVGLWLTWTRDGDGLYAFGIASGCFTLAALIATAVLAWMNVRPNVRKLTIVFGILAALHLTFVLIIALMNQGGDNPNYATPALFTVYLVLIQLLVVYLILRERKSSVFGTRDSGSKEILRREDLGDNPTEAIADQVANPENNPDRKPGRDEKTGIVSL